MYEYVSFYWHTYFSKQIENQKLDFKAQSKIGSLENVKHRPGGGDIKIFDDKDYIKQIGHSPLPDGSRGQSRQEVISLFVHSHLPSIVLSLFILFCFWWRPYFQSCFLVLFVSARVYVHILLNR